MIARPRELSDHSPISLSSNAVVKFGPPPFKFFNSWLLMDGIEDVVHTTWSNFRGYGMADRQLLAKFKFLKQALRRWRNEKYKIENQEIEALKSRIESIEAKAEVRSLSEFELSERNEGVQKILEYERKRVLDLRQKFGMKWSIDGDENSKFFHGYLN